MKLGCVHAMPLAIGALAAAATIAMAPAVAAPPKRIAGPTTTVYSDTFTPLKRIPDSPPHSDSGLAHARRDCPGRSGEPPLTRWQPSSVLADPSERAALRAVTARITYAQGTALHPIPTCGDVALV